MGRCLCFSLMGVSVIVFMFDLASRLLYNICACVLGPGSFVEVQKLLPLLTAASPDHPSFHVVAFSLPGYGFSEAPHKPGFAGKQYAEVRPYSLSYPSALKYIDGSWIDRWHTS